MDVKLIRAFIASPGGLDAERKAAFDAAEEINRSVAQPLGARLELIGWEETLSGYWTSPGDNQRGDGDLRPFHRRNLDEMGIAAIDGRSLQFWLRGGVRAVARAPYSD
jgi:hypothetical protein